MNAATRNLIRVERDRVVRDRVGVVGNGSRNDPSLAKVVWLPTARRRPHARNIFLAEAQYEGRLAA